MTCTDVTWPVSLSTIFPAFALLPGHFHTRENALWTHRRRVGTPLILAMGPSVPLVRFFFWVSLSSTDNLTTRKGAGMMGHTSDRNSNRTQGGNTRQRPKDEDEALMRDLEQREKSLNAVFLSVREPFHHLLPRALRGLRRHAFFARRPARSPPASCIASCTTFEIRRAYRNRFYTL